MSSNQNADLLENPIAAVLHRSGCFGRFFLLYGGKVVYHLDLCVDVVIFAAVFCLLSNVLSLLPLFGQWDAGAGQSRCYL